MTRGGLTQATGANYVTLGLWTRQRKIPHEIDSAGRALYPPEAVPAVFALMKNQKRGGHRPE